MRAGWTANPPKTSVYKPESVFRYDILVKAAVKHSPSPQAPAQHAPLRCGGPAAWSKTAAAARSRGGLGRTQDQ